MDNKEYLAALRSLHDRQAALSKEKAQLVQDYLDSLPLQAGDEVYYTPPSTWGNSFRELKGFIFSVEVSPFDATVYYKVCLPTRAGKLPKAAKNYSYNTEENLKLRKVEESND